MAKLVPCPACGRECSKNAKLCLGCGHHWPGQQGAMTVVSAFLILLALGCLGVVGYAVLELMH